MQAASPGDVVLVAQAAGAGPPNRITGLHFNDAVMQRSGCDLKLLYISISKCLL